MCGVDPDRTAGDRVPSPAPVPPTGTPDTRVQDPFDDVPTSRQIADNVQDRVDSAAAHLARAGQDVVEPAVRDGLDALNESAHDAVQTLRGEAQSAADDVRQQATDAGDAVRNES